MQQERNTKRAATPSNKFGLSRYEVKSTIEPGRRPAVPKHHQYSRYRRRIGCSRYPHAAHQAPWATVISCADSRVPPELIFGGHGVGELFVARNAGNLVDTATLGTVEYGAAVLGSPFIVVLAHTSCGAVKAACDVVTKNATYPGAIGPMIEPILPAALAVRSDPGDLVDNAAKESAKRTARRLTTASTLIAGLAGAGKLKIAAAIYDLNTGVVTYLD